MLVHRLTALASFLPMFLFWPCRLSASASASAPAPVPAPPAVTAAVAVAVGPQGDSRRRCNNNLSLGLSSPALSHSAYLPSSLLALPLSELSKLSPTQKCHKQQSQQESDRSPGRGSWWPKPQGRRISQWNMYRMYYTPIDSVLVPLSLSLSLCGVMQYSL